MLFADFCARTEPYLAAHQTAQGWKSPTLKGRNKTKIVLSYTNYMTTLLDPSKAHYLQCKCV